MALAQENQFLSVEELETNYHYSLIRSMATCSTLCSVLLETIRALPTNSALKQDAHYHSTLSISYF